jgi:integrase
MRRGKLRWLLDLRYLGGTREFYATEDIAARRREEVLKEVRAHGVKALALPYSRLVEYVTADERLAKLSATLGQAIDFFEAHHKAVEPLLFSKAIEEFYGVKVRSNKDEEYVRKLKSTLVSLKSSCGDKMLSEITRREIEKWLFRDGWKPDTIRSHRINVRTFFKYALGKKWIALNPAEHLEGVERSNKPPCILTVDECAKLLRGCPPYFLPYVVLNLLCGIRPRECSKLLPENIQIERGYVEVSAFRGDMPIAKSRKRRLVDLSDNAKAWLRICDLTFLAVRGKKWFARQLPIVREAAGLTRWPKNCLRHSFASYHLAMHGDAGKTSTVMGHKDTDQLFQHYREVVTRDEAERFWAIKPI